MKSPFSLILLTLLTHLTFAEEVSSPSVADAFVRQNAPTQNFGRAGALAVSGTSAMNASGTMNGRFDTVIRFNTTTAVAHFNTTWGANNWVVLEVRLRLTEVGAPSNSLFNRGVGEFSVHSIHTDPWIEGTGAPNNPSANGITFSRLQTLLENGSELPLGTFMNSGQNGTTQFPLELSASFVEEIQAGGDINLYLSAVSPGIGFTFHARDFGTATARPHLVILAGPTPQVASIVSIEFMGENLVLTATGGVPGEECRLKSATDLALPRAEWTLILTELWDASGEVVFSLPQDVLMDSQRFFLFE
jgi:hypothetical protein